MQAKGSSKSPTTAFSVESLLAQLCHQNKHSNTKKSVLYRISSEWRYELLFLAPMPTVHDPTPTARVPAQAQHVARPRGRSVLLLHRGPWHNRHGPRDVGTGCLAHEPVTIL